MINKDFNSNFYIGISHKFSTYISDLKDKSLSFTVSSLHLADSFFQDTQLKVEYMIQSIFFHMKKMKQYTMY